MHIEEFDDLYGPFFSYDEFKCPCDHCDCEGERIGAVNGDDGRWFRTPEFTAFMWILIDLRTTLAFPFKINSGYRCPDYNDSFYGGRGTNLEGPHTKGSCDISVSFERAYALINKATARKLGVGINQHDKVANRFVHIDNLGPRLWTY